MTKAKKAIGVILAVVMLATMFAFGSLAVTPGNATFTVTPSATNVEVNDTVTVTVKVTTDYYASAVGVPVHFDASLFDFVAGSFTPNTDIYGAAGSADYRANYDDNGCFTVAFAPKSEVAGAKATVLTDVTLFTFQLTAKANGVSPVQLKAEDQKTAANMTGTLYCGQQPTSELDYSQTVLVGQTFTLNNSSVTIGGASEPNTLVIKDTAPSQPVIDLQNKSEEYTGSVYGMDTLGWNDDLTPEGAIADYLTTTLGDEYLRITLPDAGVETTGTIIEVLDTDGETVLETYVFVYFGDVDADGLVGSTDSFLASYYEVNYTGIDTLEQLMAADFDGDGWPSAAEGFLMEYYEVNYTGLPSQADTALLAVDAVYELI